MRNLLRSYGLLLFLFSFGYLQAQPGLLGGIPQQPGAVLQRGHAAELNLLSRLNPLATVGYPMDESQVTGLQMRQAPQANGQPAALMTAACGPDTVRYTEAKTTGLRAINMADSIAFGQWYPAPQPISVSGFSFYAWVDSATNQTVPVICRIYNAGLDSLPTGAPLATTTVTIDSNFYNGSLALLEKHATFTFPVSVNGPYVITIENNTGIAVSAVSNDFAAGDGQAEWLGHIYLPTTWYHGFDINLGGTVFNADWLFNPHVSYQLTAAYQPNPGTGCTNVAASFVNQSSPILFSRFYNQAVAFGQTPRSSTWNYGDGSPEVQVVNGQHVYSTVGGYSVTLRDSMFGWSTICVDSVVGTINIQVGTPISAAYNYTAAGQVATFTDASVINPTAWFWDFGDGNTSNLQNPIHTYANPGTYTVCLVAGNTCGADTFCQTVLVGPPPIASCDTIGNITGNAALYLSPGGGYVSGHNTFLDSAKAEQFTLGANFAFQEALYFFGHKESPTPLTSKVIATVWDATGAGGAPGAVLAAQDLTFANIDTTGALTSVVFPSIIGTNGNFYVGFQLIYQAGDTVGLVTNTIGQTSPATAWELQDNGNWVPYDDTTSWGIGVSNAIWVVQAVEAGFTQTVAGQTATFTDQSIGATGWLWDFGDGNTSTQQNPTHTYAQPGTYLVCQVALNGNCNDSTCTTVTIGGGCPDPVAAFTANPNNLVVNFTDNSTTANQITTWLWDFGDGNTSPQQSPTHTYALPGTYLVCLTVTDSCGTDSVCQSVTVSCPPLVAAFQDTVIGLQYGAQDISTGTPTTWFWDFGDGNTSTQQNVIHTYAQAGVYTVCLTVSDSCSTDSTCATVIIGCPIPIADWTHATTGQVVNFSDLSTNLPTTWFWDFGDGNTSTLQNPTHTYATVDTFIVCLTVSSVCGADTLCDTVITGCNTPVAAYTANPAGLTVGFTDQSTQTPVAWFWDFGDGNTSTQQNPTHTYAQPGTYTVCLTATNACGTDSTCSSVTVTCPAPTSAFAANVGGLNATFTDQSTGSPTTWFWDFGDGNTSTQQNPNHAYAQPGSYQVCLTVTSVCGTNTSCQLVTAVCPVPAGNFTYNSINLAYNFADLSTGNPIAWFWDFGDGNTSTQQNPNHVYANTGTFQVCLFVTNACGTDTICQAVTVTCPAPQAGYSFNANNLTVSFNDATTGGPTNWQWDFGDGNGFSIQQNPTYTYSQPGTYYVCLVAINACGANTFCDSITVGCPAPSANFNFLTIGNTTNFTDQSAGAPTTWFWDFGDGNTSTLQNPSHTYTSTDTFDVCLVVGSICGLDTICQPVIINCVPPAADFSFAVNNDSVVTFTNMASLNTTAWTWYFGDGGQSTAANPTHTYTQPGTYQACLVVTNTCGIDTLCQQVVITCTNPTAGYTVSLNNSVATFSDVSILPQSWFWDFGDGNTSTLQNPVHAYTQSGVFTVCLTVTNFCGTNTSCQNIVVNCEDPIAGFNFQNGATTVSFTDLSVNNPTSWFWDFGDGSTDTLQNPVHGYLFAGQFYVCLTATNSCGSADTCAWITVTAVSSPEAEQVASSLEVFPNPGNGLYTIRLDLPKGMDLNYEVRNVLGQEVYRREEGIRNGLIERSIDLSDLANGMYTLEIQVDGQRITRKLIKR